MKKSLKKCRSGKDFIRYAGKQAEIQNGKGSHSKVVTDAGMVVIPHHNKDLGRGLRFHIIKSLIKIGVICLPLLLIALSVFVEIYG